MASERDLEQIVELVRRLSPQERRQLLQRLRVSGLLPAQNSSTDQNRLSKAPALGETRQRADVPLEQGLRRRPVISHTAGATQRNA